MTALAGDLPVREHRMTYYRIPNQDEAILDAMLSILPKNDLSFEEWINVGSAALLLASLIEETVNEEK
jgi:hypothetical protein